MDYKAASIFVGVCVDGTAVYAPTIIPADASVCPICEGCGTIETWDGNPSHRDVTVSCPGCDGEGIVVVETQEDEE